MISDADRRAQIEALFESDNAALTDAPFITVAAWLALRDTAPARGESVVLVDIRESEETAVSTIPGAIARAAFEADRERYRSATIVSYCTIGGRAGRYTQSLRADGFSALNLKGSVLAWADAGRAFIGPDGAHTRRVHVSGPRWLLLPPGYEGVC